MTTTLRTMTARDVGAVARLEAAIFADPWTPGTFIDELAAMARVWIVAESDGVVVGYAGAMLVEADVHVMNLAVVP